jgi:hypothetical protein
MRKTQIVLRRAIRLTRFGLKIDLKNNVYKFISH